MSLIVTKNGDVKLIENLRAYLDTCSIGLFVNNYIPTENTVLANLTEAGFPGYARQAATPWGAAFLNGLGKGESDLPAKTWTSTGANFDIVFGYFVIDPAGVVVFSERLFGSGVPMFPAGQSLVLNLKFTGVSEFV